MFTFYWCGTRTPQYQHPLCKINAWLYNLCGILAEFFLCFQTLSFFTLHFALVVCFCIYITRACFPVKLYFWLYFLVLLSTSICCLLGAPASSFQVLTCFNLVYLSVYNLLFFQGLLLEFLQSRVVEFKDIGGRMIGWVLYYPCSHYYF